MRSWLRKELGWFVLAVTMLSLPGPATKACACARMKMDAEAAQVAKKDCPRCQTALAPALGTTQIARKPCCKARTYEAHAAATPAKVMIERHETRMPVHSAIAPAPAVRSSSSRGSRAPPSRGGRESAAPPASYLSDYLRL